MKAAEFLPVGRAEAVLLLGLMDGGGAIHKEGYKHHFLHLEVHTGSGEGLS